MTFKLVVLFAMVWGVLAVFGAITELRTTPSSSDPTFAMLNRMAQPDQHSISDPTLGDAEQESTFGALIQIGTVAKDWLTFMARAALLDFDGWWTGSLNILRLIFVIPGIALLLMIGWEGLQIIAGMFRGLAGAAAGVAGIFFCDARLKSDVRPAPSALERVELIEAVTFRPRGSRRRGYGVRAQDLERVFPEAVGRILGWRYVRWHVLAVLALQAVRELRRGETP